MSETAVAAAAGRPAAAGATVRAAVSKCAASLAAAGCDTPRLDAELLLAHVLGVDRARLVIDARAELGGDAVERFDELVGRRVVREPVAYILGRRAFRRIELAVDPRVLIPRPETELLVEAGLTVGSNARVVDVGTGSGAVALALKYERGDLAITGVDSSVEALAVARANARRLGLDVRFVAGDLLAQEGPFDAVLANLPYVAEGVSLPPEIAGHEPFGALFAGLDGLDVIRRLVGSLSDEISVVGLEVGFDQADAVAGLLSGAGFGAVERLRDLAGHERVIVGRR